MSAIAPEASLALARVLTPKLVRALRRIAIEALADFTIAVSHRPGEPTEVKWGPCRCHQDVRDVRP